MVILKKIFDTPFALVGGNITSIAEGVGQAQGRVVNISLDDGLKIAFWDSQNQKMCTRIKLASPKVGAFISVLVMFKDEEKRNAVAVNFKYSGIWDFKQEEPTPTMSGKIMDIIDEGDAATVVLEDGRCSRFENVEKGYQMAKRLKKKAKIDQNIDIFEKDGVGVNFKIDNNNWELAKSVSAIIGKTRFIDEGTSAGRPYIKTKVSFYNGKDQNGQAKFENKNIYFTNDHNKDMIGSIREKIKPNSNVAIVGVQSSQDNYEGYFYFPLK
jgi:hypothetical protein